MSVSRITAPSLFLLFLLLFSCTSETSEEPVVVRAPAKAPLALVLDLYDVKDLTVPIQSYPGGWGPSPDDPLDDPPREDEEEGKIHPLEGDDIADLIRDTIDVSVWGSGGVVEYREGGILIVKAPAATHDRVQRLLEALRQASR